jgi:subtilisin family serine protease
MTRLAAFLALAVAVLALGGVDHRLAGGARGARTELVVTLGAPPLAHAAAGAARIDAEQRAFRRELAERIPEARLRWRYRLVANGFAVVLPSSQVPQLRELPGVRDVFASASYGPMLDDSPEDIGAPAVWGPGLNTAGQGMKIGIIDTGLDQRHAFFDPAGYAMPQGFPKGQRAYTTSKVIVARAFPPQGATSRLARAPFDPGQSGHGTHVAGIAAGNSGTRATRGRTVSGIAPRAYIGNYKALTRTENGLSPNGNAPELVAAIEAAVADGMDVINLSLGEPEIEPSRDVVALALDAAAAAGVVPVVAAGNEYDDAGAGSISSPGSAAGAITVAAVETDDLAATSFLAEFSSVGPTPISLRLKPDVSAPGVGILSSVPNGWSSISGTSMAAPHVAGAAALLRQRHPTWTVAEIKSALVQSATSPRRSDAGKPLAGPAFAGGGVISLPAADRPLLFAEPSGLSLALLPRGARVTGSILLRDAGDGAGTWQVSVEPSTSPTGAALTVPETVEVPGELSWDVAVSPSAAEGEVSGYVMLRRGADARRVPFWGRVAVAALTRHALRPLTRQGVHDATTRGRPAILSRYRYPEDPAGLGVTTVLAGPELVYRVRLTRRVANFGVAVTNKAAGSRVEPRVVASLDENRLTGYAGLPTNGNPYLFGFHTPVLAAGALSPQPGEYAVVFDSETRADAGAFRFRFWVNDVTPPTVRVRSRSVARGRPLLVAVSDEGSGVYPGSIVAWIDGFPVEPTLRRGLIRISTARLELGRHRLRLRVSDYQETKNTENVARILPNTRVLTATFTIRRG